MLLSAAQPSKVWQRFSPASLLRFAPELLMIDVMNVEVGSSRLSDRGAATMLAAMSVSETNRANLGCLGVLVMVLAGPLGSVLGCGGVEVLGLYAPVALFLLGWALLFAVLLSPRLVVRLGRKRGLAAGALVGVAIYVAIGIAFGMWSLTNDGYPGLGTSGYVGGPFFILLWCLFLPPFWLFCASH